MASPIEAPRENGSDHGTIARICDYWFGGSNHTEVDREVGDHFLLCAPHLTYLARAQRALLQRMVRYLAGRGVRQFLDLGSGLPTVGNVHQIAQDIDPECRVVYVDLDPGVAQQGSSLLAGSDNVAFLHEDARYPCRVLEAPEVTELLDFSEPVAVLMIDLLHHIPDSDDPAALVAAYIDVVNSGGYLGLSHISEDELIVAGLDTFSRMFGTPPAVTFRDPVRFKGFFGGLDLVEPGVVPVPLWKPAPDQAPDRNPEHFRVHAGLGRKP